MKDPLLIKAHSVTTNRQMLSRRRRPYLVAALSAWIFIYFYVAHSSQQKALQSFEHYVLHDVRGDPAREIQAHIQQARKRFNKWQDTQSNSEEEAVKKFTDRYARSPPNGYLQWAQFALEHKSISMDDYDQIEASTKPLRIFTPAVLNARIANFIERKQSSIGILIVQNHSLFVSGYGPEYQNQRMMDVLAPFNNTNELPDMIVPINWADGPNSFALPEWRSFDDETVGNRGCGAKDRFAQLTQSCSTSRIATIKLSSDRPTIDICEQKAENDGRTPQHGVWQMGHNPVDSLFPLLSWTKLSTQTDVIIPQTCYTVPGYRAWDRPDNISFEEKHGSLFWRGSTTGFAADESNWRYGHRQRFVLLNHLMKQASVALRSDGRQVAQSLAAEMLSEGKEARLSLQALTNLPPDTFDVSFTSISCEKNSTACKSMEKEMPLARYTPRTDAFQHKYLFDLDGNSMSCRFYWLLESNAVVFKQTTWAEWHDERLVPWLHYVPISMGMQELPVLLDFFENSKHGPRLAAQIAADSKEWTAMALRKIDITIYYYRLLVELGSLLT